MSSVHLTVGAPAEIDDDASRVILDGAVHLWVETYGKPEGGDVLTVLWCGPRDYPPADGAPHGHLDAPAAWNAVAGLSVIVTDDAEARDHGLAWCELERL